MDWKERQELIRANREIHPEWSDEMIISLHEQIMAEPDDDGWRTSPPFKYNKHLPGTEKEQYEVYRQAELRAEGLTDDDLPF